MILDDIRSAVAWAIAERAAKVSLGFPEPRLVILVGNRAAFAAHRMSELDRELTGVDYSTFEGHDLEFGGCAGVDVVWRA